MLNWQGSASHSDSDSDHFFWPWLGTRTRFSFETLSQSHFRVTKKTIYFSLFSLWNNAHCSNGSYRTFYAGKFSIYEISIYSIHETLRDCLRYTWVKALHSNFFPSVQQELSPKPVAPRQWNNLYPPQFYQTNILTRFDGRGGTGLETAGLWSLVLIILFRRYWRLNYYFFSSFSFHIVSAIEWCSNSNKLVRLIENFSFHPWLSHGFLASLS